MIRNKKLIIEKNHKSRCSIKCLKSVNSSSIVLPSENVIL